MAICALMLSVVTVGLVGADKAGAQSYNFFDYGWVMGYYGGVHIYQYDHCPYVPSGTAKETCLEIHYDHHIASSNTMVPDQDNLPDGMWIGQITSGQYGVSGLALRWDPRGHYTNGGHIYWWPHDDPNSCPPGQSVCGLYAGGALNWDADGSSIHGGNTAHARAFQLNVNNGAGGYWRAFTYLF